MILARSLNFNFLLYNIRGVTKISESSAIDLDPLAIHETDSLSCALKIIKNRIKIQSACHVLQLKFQLNICLHNYVFYGCHFFQIGGKLKKFENAEIDFIWGLSRFKVQGSLKQCSEPYTSVCIIRVLEHGRKMKSGEEACVAHSHREALSATEESTLQAGGTHSIASLAETRRKGFHSPRLC